MTTANRAVTSGGEDEHPSRTVLRLMKQANGQTTMQVLRFCGMANNRGFKIHKAKKGRCRVHRSSFC